MSSPKCYKLWEWQVTRLRELSAPASLVMKSAIQRWRNGEIDKTVIQKEHLEQNCSDVLLPITIRHRYAGIDSKTMRMILAAHLDHPVDFTGEIISIGDEIERWYNSLEVVDT